jgi:hypothetical protein
MPEIGTTERSTEMAWGDEDLYWRGEYHRRPYARADRGYDYYRAAYQYGTRAAQRAPAAAGGWHGVENHLAKGWDGAGATWEEIRDAVRDAWERVRGRLTAR